MKRGSKVGRKSFENDSKAYKLFLSKLADMSGFDETSAREAMESTYKEINRVVNPVKQTVKNRLFDFYLKHQEKIREDLELYKENPLATMTAPGAVDSSSDDSSASSGDELEDSDVSPITRKELFVSSFSIFFFLLMLAEKKLFNNFLNFRSRKKKVHQISRFLIGAKHYLQLLIMYSRWRS